MYYFKTEYLELCLSTERLNRALVRDNCVWGAVFTEFGIGRRYSSLWASCLLTTVRSDGRGALCITLSYANRHKAVS